MLLTKRPERITEVMCDDGLNLGFFELAHCWLGASTENQAAADKRIPALLDVDAAVHFISAEPLLGPINLDSEDAGGLHALGCGGGKYCACGTAGLDLVICGGESGPGARMMHPDWARSLRDQCNEAEVSFFFKQWGDWPKNMLRGDCLVPGNWNTTQHKGGSLLDGREWKEFPSASK
jgi:protein gp37